MMCLCVCCKNKSGWPRTWKPEILRDFSETGKLREFCATSGKNCNKVFLVCHSNICVKQLLTCCIAGVDVE